MRESWVERCDPKVLRMEEFQRSCPGRNRIPKSSPHRHIVHIEKRNNYVFYVPMCFKNLRNLLLTSNFVCSIVRLYKKYLLLRLPFNRCFYHIPHFLRDHISYPGKFSTIL